MPQRPSFPATKPAARLTRPFWTRFRKEHRAKTVCSPAAYSSSARTASSQGRPRRASSAARAAHRLTPGPALRVFRTTTLRPGSSSRSISRAVSAL